MEQSTKYTRKYLLWLKRDAQSEDVDITEMIVAVPDLVRLLLKARGAMRSAHDTLCHAAPENPAVAKAYEVLHAALGEDG